MSSTTTNTNTPRSRESLLAARACLNIFEFKALCESDDIELVQRAVRDKTNPTAAPTMRYFWNRKHQEKGGGNIVLLIGDLLKPVSSHPFLLRKPEKHKDADASATALGAFTAIPDPEEAAAWEFVQNWMLDVITAAGIIKLPKKNAAGRMEPMNATRDEVESTGFAPIAMLPTDIGRHVCVSQKLQMASGELQTQFHFIKTVPRLNDDKAPVLNAAGEPMQSLRRCGTFDPAEVLIPSTRIFTVVELGELRKTQGKFRSMLYVRQCLVEQPKKVQHTAAIVMGGLVLEDEAEDDDAIAGDDDTSVANTGGGVADDDGQAVPATGQLGGGGGCGDGGNGTAGLPQPWWALNNLDKSIAVPESGTAPGATSVTTAGGPPPAIPVPVMDAGDASMDLDALHASLEKQQAAAPAQKMVVPPKRPRAMAEE